MTKFLVRNFLVLFFFSSFFLWSSCARKGRPSGGPKDETPPVLLRAIPDTFSKNVARDLNKIELSFDEYVVLKDYMKNILISPPVEPSPTFSPAGIASKKVKVEFQDSLLAPNTTYTINFGQSIQDNNEGNPYSYFTYVFSTGDVIDSLELKGKVSNPNEREMPKDVIAALYKIDSTYNDSLIYTTKPYYVAKIDSANQFDLRYLHEGKYKLVAFNDETPNMKFDLKTEKLAFHPEIVEAGSVERFDLNLFKPKANYRAVEAVQAEYGKLEFYFEGKPESVKIVPLEHEFTTAKIFHKPYSDTLAYYFNPRIDTLMDKRARLKFAVEHNGILDTIPSALYDNEKTTQLNVYGRKLSYVPEMSYQVEANYPLDTLNKEYILVEKDSLDIDFEVRRLKNNRFALDFPIDFDGKYKISLLPEAAKDFMQRTNDTLDFKFGVRNIKEYGNLNLNIVNKPATSFWLKLFDKQDKEIKSIYGAEDTFEFKYLNPGEYYFKLIVDENSNGRYDTGNLFENRQPEAIYIYNGNVTVRAYWDIDETWILGDEENKTKEDEVVPSEPKKVDIKELQPKKPNKNK